MPKLRNRTETCPYCHMRRGVTVNLETEEVVSVETPMVQCLYGYPKCVEELRDKALLAPFEDGKTRHR